MTGIQHGEDSSRTSTSRADRGQSAVRSAGLAVCVLIVVTTGLGCRRSPTAVTTMGGGVRLAWSATQCRAAQHDSDRDDLDDGCEFELAQAFAPELIVDSRDCLWQAGTSPARLAGGYLFAAQPLGEGVRLAYLPAYYRDCGWSGAACVVRAGRCGSHSGDSELILVDVEPSVAGDWRTTAVFLSAHCFGRSDGRCRWYRGDELSSFEWLGGNRSGAPRVWVARGKHANYPTQDSCDSGHWFLDTCDGNGVQMRFPILTPRQNIGSRRHPSPPPGGCLVAAELPIPGGEVAEQATECLWSEAREFGGWQSDTSRRATAYSRYLTRVASF